MTQRIVVSEEPLAKGVPSSHLKEGVFYYRVDSVSVSKNIVYVKLGDTIYSISGRIEAWTYAPHARFVPFSGTLSVINE